MHLLLLLSQRQAANSSDHNFSFTALQLILNQKTKGSLVFILFALTFFGLKSLFAQTDSLKYITFSTELGRGSFRDLGTSPLIYRGNTTGFGIEYEKFLNNKERSYGIFFTTGNFKHRIAAYGAVSELRRVSLYYAKLYPLKTNDEKKIKFHYGAKIQVDANMRDNSAFGNNSLGVEIFPSFSGSVQASTDVSRKKLKEKKILFLKYTLYPIQRQLQWRLNIGLINSVLRNPFALFHSGTLPNGSPADDFTFKLFSGKRLSSVLKYYWTLSNKNKIRASYKWELWTSSKKQPNHFVMTQHSLGVSYLFNKPKRK